MGGLGNQMFQAAAGFALSKQQNTKLKLDLSFLRENNVSTESFTAREYELGIFNTRFEVATQDEIDLFYHNRKRGLFANILRRIKRPVILAEDYNVDGYFLNSRKYSLIDGYWQNEKYFSHLRNEIIDLFRFPTLPTELSKIEEEVKQSNAVSLHFRRGDYVSIEKTNNYHGICSLDYYYRAMAILASYNTEYSYFVFSDDIEWVKSNLDCPNKKIVFIDRDIFKDNWNDLYLMSLCKHNIIANSSFSWWGAWLNNNPDKIVIAPINWFNDKTISSQTKDLIPEKWLRI